MTKAGFEWGQAPEFILLTTLPQCVVLQHSWLREAMFYNRHFSNVILSSVYPPSKGLSKGDLEWQNGFHWIIFQHKSNSSKIIWNRCFSSFFFLISAPMMNLWKNSQKNLLVYFRLRQGSHVRLPPSDSWGYSLGGGNSLPSWHASSLFGCNSHKGLPLSSHTEPADPLLNPFYRRENWGSAYLINLLGPTHT